MVNVSVFIQNLADLPHINETDFLIISCNIPSMFCIYFREKVSRLFKVAQ